MLSYDIVCGPVNINSNHWILWILLVKTKKLLIFDSANMNMDDKVSAQLNWIAKQFQSKHSGFKKIRMKCPQQNNGIDCGVFVCVNLLRIVFPEEIVDQILGDISRVRNHMAACIAAGNLIGVSTLPSENLLATTPKRKDEHEPSQILQARTRARK
jgi:Ulp1 family protease